MSEGQGESVNESMTVMIDKAGEHEPVVIQAKRMIVTTAGVTFKGEGYETVMFVPMKRLVYVRVGQ